MTTRERVAVLPVCEQVQAVKLTDVNDSVIAYHRQVHAANHVAADRVSASEAVDIFFDYWRGPAEDIVPESASAKADQIPAMQSAEDVHLVTMPLEALEPDVPLPTPILSLVRSVEQQSEEPTARPSLRRIGRRVLGAIADKFRPSRELAPDQSDANRQFLAQSERGRAFLPYYETAIQYHTGLRTVSLVEYNDQNPIRGAHPSFNDRRHRIAMPLRDERTTGDLAKSYPIVEEVCGRLDPASPSEEYLRVARLTVDLYELARASLMVGFNGEHAKYHDLIDQGVDGLPFRKAPLDTLGGLVTEQYVHDLRDHFSEKFQTSHLPELIKMQRARHRELKHVAYAENFVRYISWRHHQQRRTG